VKYRIDLYTVDKLMDWAERLHLQIEVAVVWLRYESAMKIRGTK
jgi:hypothetical protein